jgi:GNAT superfamily N-acetyltransferase
VEDERPRDGVPDRDSSCRVVAHGGARRLAAHRADARRPQFVSAVCQWARDAGYPKVTLSTFRAVPWNQAFYEKRGFRVVDAHDLGPDHVALVASERDRGLRTDLRVVMQRALTADTTLGR